MVVGPEASGECGICYETYRGARGGRAPQQLPCRHSLCLSCLRKLVCRAAAVAFISCPFCRMVTLVPELAPHGPGAMPASGTPRGEEEEEGEEGSGAPPATRQASARSMAVEVACAAHTPVFAVSGVVSPCGLRRGSEVPGAFMLGLPGRGLLLDTQPPLASMENLRLGFAAGILVLIVSTFFLLVFLK
ncbi:E3 ubiquitin-protein ligase RNF186-like [Grus japonensis]|uniref:E3 ubiquitin-protein ligase RNF186-like n=1 Tax=Grus japonensis TaxID=30415 RepID=A0ABC9XKX2_GRUJA